MELESSDLWKLITENGWDKGSKILPDPKGTLAQRFVHQLLLMQKKRSEEVCIHETTTEHSPRNEDTPIVTTDPVTPLVHDGSIKQKGTLVSGNKYESY
jgi:hypothetical protein